MNTPSLASIKDIGYGLILSAALLSVVATLLVIVYCLAFMLNADWLLGILYLLHPINQGLSDHLNFSFTLLLTLSSFLLICAFLIPRIRHLIVSKVPWIIAGSIGIVAGVLMLIDMRFNMDYQLYKSTGIVVFVQALIVVVGFLFQWLRSRKR